GEELEFCQSYFPYCRACADVLDDCQTTRSHRNCSRFCDDYLVKQALEKDSKKDCLEIPVLQNGTFDTRGPHKHGDVVVATCDPGFTLLGHNTLTCGKHGQWDNTPPTCKDSTSRNENNDENVENTEHIPKRNDSPASQRSVNVVTHFTFNIEGKGEKEDKTEDKTEADDTSSNEPNDTSSNEPVDTLSKELEDSSSYRPADVCSRPIQETGEFIPQKFH
ncbi:hypothetical protein MAR_014510, partial [Mya arenaria]